MRAVARPVLLLFAALLLISARAQAQQLEDVLEQFVRAWTQGDAREVAGLLVRDGFSLETRIGRLGPLGQRQASALLRRIFEENETVSMKASSPQIVGGAPQRAFGQITWVRRAPETTQPERATIFLELVEENNRWRISQIRLLR